MSSPESPTSIPSPALDQTATDHTGGAARSCHIHMHHVGGRDGGFPVALAPAFRGDVRTYLYDADPDCLEHMQRNSPDEDQVLTEAVGASDGPATFHVNYDPYTSSLRPLGGADWFYPDRSCDYIIGDALRPLREFTVQAKTLATIRRERGLAIDYLSLDVQGAEFELLAALDDEGWRDVIAVKTEVSTRQLYAGQSLFHDVCAQLYGRGFELTRFPSGPEFSNLRTGLGWRGSGTLIHGDAVFLRNHQHLARHGREPALSLFKLAFLSLCDGNVAHALQCAMAAEKRGGLPPEAGAMRYVSLLKAMLRLHEAEETLMPLRFPHLWTAEQSEARFKPEGAVPSSTEEIRARYFAEVGEERYRRLMPRLLDPAPTEFEQLLQEHGLTGLAEDVRQRRLKGARQTATVIGTEPEAAPATAPAAPGLAVQQGGHEGVRVKVCNLGDMSITGWRTIATVTPSNVSGSWALSKARIEIVANTNGVGAGLLDAQAFVSIAGGSPTAGIVGSPVSHGIAPQLRLVTAADNSVEVQIASPNETNYIANGLAKIEFMLSEAEGVPLTWTIR